MEYEAKVRSKRDPNAPIRPNMLVVNGNGTCSTLARVDWSHSILTQVKLFNSRIHQSNFESCSFDDCDFDGATFSGCSLRGVEFINCDLDRVIVNGMNIGALLRLISGPAGGK